MIDLPRQMTVQETQELIEWGKGQNSLQGNNPPVGLLFIDIEAACPATGMLLTDIRRLPAQPNPSFEWRTLCGRNPCLRFETFWPIFRVNLQNGMYLALLEEFSLALGLPIDLYETQELGRRITHVPLTGRFETINGTLYQTGGKPCNSRVPFYNR